MIAHDARRYVTVRAPVRRRFIATLLGAGAKHRGGPGFRRVTTPSTAKRPCASCRRPARAYRRAADPRLASGTPLGKEGRALPGFDTTSMAAHLKWSTS